MLTFDSRGSLCAWRLVHGILVPPVHGTAEGVLPRGCGRRGVRDPARGMLRTLADQGDLAVRSSRQRAPPQTLGSPIGTLPVKRRHTCEYSNLKWKNSIV